jgi:hypothetical protein
VLRLTRVVRASPKSPSPSFCIRSIQRALKFVVGHVLELARRADLAALDTMARDRVSAQLPCDRSYTPSVSSQTGTRGFDCPQYRRLRRPRF